MAALERLLSARIPRSVIREVAISVIMSSSILTSERTTPLEMILPMGRQRTGHPSSFSSGFKAIKGA